MAGGPAKVSRADDGSLLRLTLSRPKANIVDAAMIGSMQEALDANLEDPALLAVLIDAEGPHFSFGASVEEHMPEQCAVMLAKIHRLVMTLVDSPVPVLAAVQGMCLGGGLEIVLGATRIFAASGSSFGQPEIKLGVFAPAASCLLPARVGQARAEDLLFSGRTIDVGAAFAIGLVDEVSANPVEGALAYFDEHLAPRSGFSLRQAVRAARGAFATNARLDIERVERQYLEQLMTGRDPTEGLGAFLDKRTPLWENR